VVLYVGMLLRRTLFPTHLESICALTAHKVHHPGSAFFEKVLKHVRGTAEGSEAPSILHLHPTGIHALLCSALWLRTSDICAL
jgi:hypothetical protein